MPRPLFNRDMINEMTGIVHHCDNGHHGTRILDWNVPFVQLHEILLQNELTVTILHGVSEKKNPFLENI